MACWPANVVGAFFLSLIIIDCMIGDYDDLIPHSLVGVLATLGFWLICAFLGQDLSAALLVVPSVLVICFTLSIWFIGNSLKNGGYCMSRGGGPPPIPQPIDFPPPTPSIKKCNQPPSS